MSTYYERALAKIRELFTDGKHHAEEEVVGILRAARAGAGGDAAAEKRRAAKEENDAEPAIAAESITLEAMIALASEPSFDEIRSNVQAALRQRYGRGAWIMDIWNDAVVWTDETGMMSDGAMVMLRAPYTTGENGVEFGAPVKVESRRDYVPIAADDDGTAHYYAPSTRIRLEETESGEKVLSPYQHLHVVGEWAVEHGSGQRIKIERADGDRMIENFNAGVIGKPVTLDEIHLTGKHGRALATAEWIGWGDESANPDPDGDFLSVKWKYNRAGRDVLLDEQFHNTSPEYTMNYVDRRTGQEYGPAVIAAAATNLPFLAGLKTFLGQSATLALDNEGADPMPTNDTPNTPPASGGTIQLSNEQYEALVKKASAGENAERLVLEERRRRIETEAEAFGDRLKLEGVPPALVAKGVRLLKLAAPDDEATIKLEDADGAPTVNMHSAIRDLMNAIPRVSLTRRSMVGDERPPSDTTVRLEDHEALKNVGRELAASALGIRANGTNGTNGTKA